MTLPIYELKSSKIEKEEYKRKRAIRRELEGSASKSSKKLEGKR